MLKRGRAATVSADTLAHLACSWMIRFSGPLLACNPGASHCFMLGWPSLLSGFQTHLGNAMRGFQCTRWACVIGLHIDADDARCAGVHKPVGPQRRAVAQDVPVLIPA